MPTLAATMLADLHILYEEGPCLAVNKPGGLLTQAPPEIDSAEARLKQFLKLRDHKPGKVYLGVPHRLDRPVSGAMVFAKHARAARRLCEQFEGREVEKTYWAVVEGDVAEERGVWIDHVRKVPNEARAETLAAEHPDARVAQLEYRVLARGRFGSWLEIRLGTGRMHQIRLQSATRGHPVLGDSLYGSRVPFGPDVADARRRWIALHARRLGFRHPMTREPVLITAPLSSHWLELGVVDASPELDERTGS